MEFTVEINNCYLFADVDMKLDNVSQKKEHKKKMVALQCVNYCVEMFFLTYLQSIVKHNNVLLISS